MISAFGALARDGGVNLAVFSDHAQAIDLCVFHGFPHGVGPGLVYGLRVHKPHEPGHGHRFNPHKLLLDPWVRDIVGHFRWRAEHHGYELGHPNGNRSFDARDNALHALKARVAEAPQAATGWYNSPCPVGHPAAGAGHAVAQRLRRDRQQPAR